LHKQSFRRSVGGRIIRRLLGESCEFNDLAEDIRKVSAVTNLQQWGELTLQRYRQGNVQTNGYARYYWDQPAGIRLAPQERPEFISHQWGDTDEDGLEEPEIFILLNDSHEPESLAIGWYDHGIRIGPTNYQMPYPPAYTAPYINIQPGIYVYGNYK
jgi:hypothetical protein